MSTFKRPVFLRSQLISLLTQTFTDFEIVVSDNDPEGSGRAVVESLHDHRIKYFHNGQNIGMIQSFNKSIERATGQLLTLITDDDPVEPTFLDAMKVLVSRHPGFSLYGGFVRRRKASEEKEIISAASFASELLDPTRTPWLLWSSVVVDAEAARQIGGIPDYGSPHLADHAFLALVGSVNGAVVVNKKYSTLSFHDANYSKVNFDSYIRGCSGFYTTMCDYMGVGVIPESTDRIILKHLRHWFISNVFTLKRYYTINRNAIRYKEVDHFARQILLLDFMTSVRPRFYFKESIFKIKRSFGLLK